MMRKKAWVVMLILLASTLSLVFNVRKTEAAGTIYIRANGAVDPLTAPISSTDNITYTFSGNITDPIVVERSNIIVDGSGYTVQGTGASGSRGMYLSNVTNVAVENVKIRGFYYGVSLVLTYGSSISDSEITSNSLDGIHFLQSSGNTISRNNVTDNGNDGIKFINASSSNVVDANVITRNNDDGIQFTGGWNNTVSGSKIIANTGIGIYAVNTSGNSIHTNDIADVYHGIELRRSSYNSMTENSISGTNHGIYAYGSASNIIARNNITGNSGDGIWLDFSPGNLVNENILETNDDIDVYIRYSQNETISRNTISSSYRGISFSGSSSNNIYGNTLEDNSNGIELSLSSLNNRFYHNNFVNNTQHVSSTTANAWNETVEGNYWSGVTLADSNQDGIGDSPHMIDSNNRDNFPLMGMFQRFNTSTGAWVNVISNSSISGFQDSESPPNVTVKMQASNASSVQTYGFCRVRIPHVLMKAPFDATVNETAPYFANYTVHDNASYRWIYLSYQHSTLEISIQGIESTPPTINIDSPRNMTYRLVDVPLNVAFDEPTSWVGYSLDGGANATIAGNTTLASLPDGPHGLVVFANDTFGNMGHSNPVYFTVDTTPPHIVIVSPENRTHGSNQVELIFTINEHVSWMGYGLDGQLNVTISGNTTIGGLADGSHRVTVYALDIVGNIGASNTTYFTIYTPAPFIVILSPQNKTYGITSIPLNFTADEPIAYAGYSLDGQANVTITGNATLTDVPEGYHHVVVYANDSDSNMGLSDTIYFAIDITAPNIVAISQDPLSDNVQSTNMVEVNVTTIDNLSGVKSAVLAYTSDNMTWTAVEMTALTDSVWNGVIPAFPPGTNVTYVITVQDYLDNIVTSEDLGYTCRYKVVPEYPIAIIPLLMTALFAVTVALRRKSTRKV